MGRPLLLLCVLVLLAPTSACQRQPTAVVPAVFHWRNNDALNYADREAIAAHGMQRVYFKVLDIGWNPANGAYPVSSVAVPYMWRGYSGGQPAWADLVQLVPAIFITNATMEQLDPEGVDRLAHNLLRTLREQCPPNIASVLLDCDWTATTRDRFFRLVRTMRDSLGVPLSATIRLHQYAHPGKTGVPPADRGMLMVYNTGKVNEPGMPNSIFSREEAAPYFTRKKPYPLPMDLALPAFSWGAHFRKGRFLGIMQEDLIDRAVALGLLKGDPNGRMQVIREENDLLPELHLGDELRMERMTPEVIRQVAELARQAVNSDTTAVAFFEVGTRAFRSLDPSFTDGIIRSFCPRAQRPDALPFPHGPNLPER